LTAHRVDIRVIYADTDAMGIVYHANYIKWFEIGRTELMRARGIAHADIAPLGFALPVTRVYCHYLLPSRLDQVLAVLTTIDYVKRASLKFTYQIWDEALTERRVEGYTVHACTDTGGRVVRLPSPLVERLRTVC
jgi:acyl-CoA thioester hydrolase